MILVDTSLWVHILRDKDGSLVNAFRDKTSSDTIVFTHFTQLELLHGEKDELEWKRLNEYLKSQYYIIEAGENTWSEAARMYFKLRRSGITNNSPIDCCIASLAIESLELLLHQDHDFERIAEIRPLKYEFLNLPF